MEHIVVIQNEMLELFRSKLQIDVNDIDSDLVIENGLDSINFINMILIIEEYFEIQIPDQFLSLSELNTINNISSIIYSCVSEQNGDENESENI